mmetsp:Transcript_24735/g.33090  ORF Transcript_24735/g.33090 Transcript_24735/m.33090 type:complete len:93 (-) Transcript_24735:1118-1396(-)
MLPVTEEEPDSSNAVAENLTEGVEDNAEELLNPTKSRNNCRDGIVTSAGENQRRRKCNAGLLTYEDNEGGASQAHCCCKSNLLVHRSKSDCV